jgi:AcrR family transcriptional regulator
VTPISRSLAKRADSVAETRQRIVEAAVRLHATIGPAATTFSALAEEAGVTRLTVYRHFPDDRALLAACGAHWASGQVLPDIEAWRKVGDPAERVRAALTDLYRYYRDGEPMLTAVMRDSAALPAEMREGSAAAHAQQRDLLLRGFRAAGARRERLRAVIGHAISFWTWRSLCHDEGLSNEDAVRAMAGLVLATAQSSKPQ